MGHWYVHRGDGLSLPPLPRGGTQVPLDNPVVRGVVKVTVLPLLRGTPRVGSVQGHGFPLASYFPP